MGSWSVSCGISNIAITSGHSCVLLPIKENRNNETEGYCPATLPIFGEYNDYGGIENIEENANTKLIEEHFGITISEFCEFLVDGKFTYDRSEAKDIQARLTNNEVEQWRFMWIDRKVYDFMIVNQDKYHKGYMDYGTPEMLTLLGFNLIETKETFKNYDPKRFNQLWKKGDVEVFSDGSTILTKKNRYVYHFGKGDETSIETYFEIPQELHFLKELHAHEAWRLSGKRKGKADLKYIFGERYGDDFDLESLYQEFAESKGEVYIPKVKVEKKLHKKYLADLETFGDSIAQLLNVKLNLYCMSGYFSPHKLYSTPQCGEFVQHQILLEKFAEINKSYIYD